MPRKKAKQIPPSEKEFDYTKFGNTVRELVYAKGYSLGAVAAAIDVSESYFGELLSGKKRMQMHTYCKLIDVLGVSDIIFLSESVSLKRILELAPSICMLLSLINDIPEDVLDALINLAKQTVPQSTSII